MNKLQRGHLSAVILAMGLSPTHNAWALKDGAAPTSASASASDREKASKHAHDGFDLLKAGELEKAREQFTIALGLVEAPTIRVGRADALTGLNRWVDAVADYEAAIAFSLSRQDPPVFAKSQQNATVRLAALQDRMPGLIIETSDAKAQVVIDGSHPISVVTGERIAVDPGRHIVVITAFGLSSTHTVEAFEAKLTTLQASEAKPVTSPPHRDASTPAPTSLRPTLTADVTQRPAPDEGLDTRTLVAGAATGALAIGAVVTGVIFWNLRNDYHDSRSEPGAADERKDVITMAWINTGITAGAVVAGGLTAYFWLTPRFEDQPASSEGEARTAFGASLLPSGAMLNTGGRF